MHTINLQRSYGIYATASASKIKICRNLASSVSSGYGVKKVLFSAEHEQRSGSACTGRKLSTTASIAPGNQGNKRLEYRHAFHAGNIADCFKHVVLGILLRRMLDKESPFTYVDTHSGSALYELQSIEASQLSEYKDGALKLLNILSETQQSVFADPPASPALQDYADAIRWCCTLLVTPDIGIAGKQRSPHLPFTANSMPSSAAADAAAAAEPAAAAAAAAAAEQETGIGRENGVRGYPGSPLLAARLLRAQDRLILYEKVPPRPPRACARKRNELARRRAPVLCKLPPQGTIRPIPPPPPPAPHTPSHSHQHTHEGGCGARSNSNNTNKQEKTHDAERAARPAAIAAPPDSPLPKRGRAWAAVWLAGSLRGGRETEVGAAPRKREGERR